MGLSARRVLGPIQGQMGPVWSRPLAWAALDCVTFANVATLVDSFNISSVTDNGTGDFTLAFVNGMANATYVVIGMVQSTGATNGGGVTVNTTGGQTTTSVRMFSVSYGSLATRFPYSSVIIIGRH
jgi:hypothetical protein